nr:monocarboxylate transporter 13-like [Dermacentor andersoni]
MSPSIHHATHHQPFHPTPQSTLMHIGMDTTSMLQRTLIIEAAPAPPDGGWGWVAVLAGFVCHLVIDGIVYSSGIFFDEFLTYFGEGYAATSWISSITFGCYLISSPVASGLTIRYGCRRIAILGSVMSSFGLFISVYATGIKFLYFSLGFITGTGFGFTLLPAIVCVTSYFDRRRSLATGITVCGSGVGTFVMAPLVQALVRVYGWKGTLIICSGLSLQVDIGDGIYVEKGLLKRQHLDANNSGFEFAGGLLKAPFTKQEFEGMSFFGRTSNGFHRRIRWIP